MNKKKEQNFKKAKASDKYDFITSLASADIFYQVANACLDELKVTGKLKDPSIIFVSGTNYGLSIELYLKSILIMEGNEDILGHDLFKLFSKLTNETKKELNKEYKRLINNEDKPVLYIRACLSSSDITNTSNHQRRGTKLHQLLKNNQDIFIMFRYMFERGRSIDVEKYYFEYGYFNVLCDALKIISKKFLEH